MVNCPRIARHFAAGAALVSLAMLVSFSMRERRADAAVGRGRRPAAASARREVAGPPATIDPPSCSLTLVAAPFPGDSGRVDGESTGWLDRLAGAPPARGEQRILPGGRLDATFELESVPGSDLHLMLLGRRHEESPDRPVRLAIVVNDRLVAVGAPPCPQVAVGPIDVLVPRDALVPGPNRLELRLLGSRGGGDSWFELDRISVSASSGPGPTFGCRGPADLSLAYRSVVNGTVQTYRIYLPTAYDGSARLPVMVALHGTTGDQNSFFDDSSYGRGSFPREAERRGVVFVCPDGLGDSEYRGSGAIDVIQVLDHVEREFQIDPDRVACCGFSMGGTGTTYLAMRYPDRFCAGISLSSCYENMQMVENLRYVPMLFIQGAYDRPFYAAEGPVPIVRRLTELGFRGRLDVLPKTRHNTLRASASHVFDWALAQRRVRNPRHVTMSTYFPSQGRAFWTEIRRLTEPGYLGRLDARIDDGNAITVRERNLAQFVLRPGFPLILPRQPVSVLIDGERAFSGPGEAGKEIVCTKKDGRWTARYRPERVPHAIVFHTTRIGRVVAPPSTHGIDETSMGDWMADMMRAVSGADVAIYNARDRARPPLPVGRELFAEDLHDWLQPYTRRLCTFRCTGHVLRQILEANIVDDPALLVQVSGCRYTYDRRRPPGSRIVWASIEPRRTYTVACEGQVFTRETICLAGRFGRIAFKELEPTSASGAWWYIRRCGGEIRAGHDGRVRDLAATPDAHAHGSAGSAGGVGTKRGTSPRDGSS